MSLALLFLSLFVYKYINIYIFINIYIYKYINIYKEIIKRVSSSWSLFTQLYTKQFQAYLCDFAPENIAFRFSYPGIP